MIEIDLDDATVALGETVGGRVVWDPSEKAPDGVKVELAFATEGRGSVDRGVVAGAEREFHGDPTMVPPWFEFELTVPDDAPVSYDGNLIRVVWRVEARLDVAWARDPKTHVEVRVLPRGA